MNTMIKNFVFVLLLALVGVQSAVPAVTSGAVAESQGTLMVHQMFSLIGQGGLQPQF